MGLPFPDAPPNFASTFITARRAGIEDRTAQARQNALAMAPTNPDAAQAGLLQAGDFTGANALGQYGAQQTQKKVLSQYGTDPTGARNAAFAAGDPQLVDMVSKLDANQRALAQDHAETIAAVGMKLKGFPYEQRKAALQALAPSFAARGIDPATVANFDPTDQNIDAAIGQAVDLKTLIETSKPVSVGAGGSLVDPTSGKTLFSSPDYKVVPEGGKLVPIGGQPGPAGAAPAASATAPAAAPATATDAPRGVRNNNFGNVRPVPGGWHGQTGVDPGGYAVFATPEDGVRAADRNLQSYGAHDGVNTLAGVIQRWAPAAADGNDPQSYVATVSQLTGIAPNQPINLADPAVRAAILPAIFHVENGPNFRLPQLSAGGAPAQAAPQGGAGAPAGHVAAQPVIAAPAPAQAPHAGDPPGTIYGDPKPGWRPSTAAEKAGAGLAPNAPAQTSPDGKVEVLNPGQFGADVAGPGSDLTGDDYLKTLPPAQQNTIKMLVGGRLPISPQALRNPQMMQLIQQAAQYEPGFDAALWGARNKMYQAFTSGDQSKKLATINSVTGHLGELYDSIDGLRNFSGVGTLLNGPTNALYGATDTRYQQARAAFDAAKTAVASDLVSALRPGGGGEKDVQDWLKQLNADRSPEQLKQTVKTVALGLIGARVDPLISQWQATMGPSSDPLIAFYPNAARALDRISGGTYALPGGAAAPDGPRASPAANIPTLSPADAAKLPKGAQFRTTDGRVLTRQ